MRMSSSRFLCRSSVLALALVLSFAGSALVAPAQSTAQLDKHSRKVAHKLDKYRQGSYLHLVLSDSTDVYGQLGTVSAASFTFNNSESNSMVTYRYGDIDRVNTDRENIGHNSEPMRIRHIMPITITAAAIAAGALTYTAMR